MAANISAPDASKTQLQSPVEPNFRPGAPGWNPVEARPQSYDLLLLLDDAARRIQSRLDCLFREIGLSLSDAKTLFVVFAHNGLTQSDLARRRGVSRVSIAIVLRRLEIRGLIERSSLDHGRGVGVFATHHAFEQRAMLFRIATQHEQALLRSGDASRFECAKAGLRKIIARHRP
jgi:DNA-binding MarR family transcriptional regulator